jgi:uncharacterized protein with ParB-like and HNH nuclease domain
MKTIKELRTVLRFHPQEVNSWLKFMVDKKIDFDVFLPSIGKNLQRGFVWHIMQKRELIWSILMNRNIPRMAMINVITPETGTDGVYQVIDGKQRLSTMIDFYNNKFHLEIDNKYYLFGDLPQEYQNVISCYAIPYLIVHEDYGNQITDQEKINWFKFINYAGTPQDLEHIKSLQIN